MISKRCVISLSLSAFFPVLLQAMVVGFLPVVGPVISLGHMCLLYSLYTFEYKWVNMGEWTVLVNPREGWGYTL